MAYTLWPSRGKRSPGTELIREYLAVGDIFTGVPLFISPLEDFPLTSFVNMKKAEFLLKSPYVCSKYEFYNPIETPELLTAV